jgi:hypothetical protein
MDGTSAEQSAMAARRADLDIKNLLGAMLTSQKQDEPVDVGSPRIRGA